MKTIVRVQAEDFNANDAVKALSRNNQRIGAVVSFVGLVRDEQDSPLVSMTVEHYPTMTTRALEDIAAAAHQRWALQGVTIIHRYGALRLGEQIVLVATAAVHRSDAFDAARYIMDYLKTDAPFWKKIQTQTGTSWVESASKDAKAKARWQKKSQPDD